MRRMSRSGAYCLPLAFSWLADCILISLLARQPLHHRDAAPELLRGQGGKAADGSAGGNVAHDAAMRGDTGSRADGEVTGKAALPAHHGEIAELCAARDADLGDKDATATHDHVVPDLDQIINHRPVA